MPAISELDRSLAHHTIDDFLDRAAGELAVPDITAYNALLHDSGVVEAVAAIVRDHPDATLLSKTSAHLHLSRGTAEIFATVYGVDDKAPLRLLSYERHRAKECYRFVGRMTAAGDAATRSWLSFEEAYYSHTLAGRPSATENLTRLVHITQTTFERFVTLVRA